MSEAAPPVPEVPGVLPVSVLGLCPKCGARTLFAGLAAFAPRCRACGLDFASFNVGDGPAAFLTFFVGALVLAVAAWLALAVDPPVWVYVVVLVPLTAGSTLLGLRWAKAALLALEYRRRAAEYRARP